MKKVKIKQMNTLPENKKLLAMKAYYEEHPPVIGVHAPETVEIIDLNVEMLINTKLPPYQRWFEQKRFDTIVKSIIEFGPSPAFIIIVNKKGDILDIHDGRHRTLAYWVLGYQNIPAVVVGFKTERDEITHFNAMNEKSVPLKYEQRLLNGYQAGDKLPCLIYKLAHQDPASKWSDKVALLGVEKRNEKMSAPNFAKILNWIGILLRRRVEGESAERALRKLEHLPYTVIRERLNAFHDWYYSFATPIKLKNDVFHKDKVLISMLEFYYCALIQNSKKKLLQPDNILNTAKSKFRTFNWQDLSGYDASTAPNQLFEHFNRSRKRNPVKRIGI